MSLSYRLIVHKASGHVFQILLAAIIVACSQAAQASTTWTGTGDGIRWDDAANWSSGLPVGGGGSGARTFIDLTGATVLIDGATNATTSRLLIADAVGSNNITINMTGGTLTTTASSSGERNWHLGAQGTATFNQTGGVVNLDGQVRMGVDNVATAQGILNIGGGTFNATGPIIMGFGNASTLVQQLNISGGSLNASRLLVDDNVPSLGGPMAVVSMTGVSMTVGDLAIPTNWGLNGLNGHFQLDGGSVTVTNASIGGQQNQPGGFRLANGPGADAQSVNTVTGTMDIKAGVMLLSGDASLLVQGYIDQGVLTGYGNPGNVRYDFDLTRLSHFCEIAVRHTHDRPCLTFARGGDLNSTIKTDGAPRLSRHHLTATGVVVVPQRAGSLNPESADRF